MLFQEIIGQEAVKQRLIQTVKDNRISHAQLFLGHEGSGSLPLAIAYAQYICCENQKPADSCGECPSCLKFAKLIHPDLHFVYPVVLSKDVEISTDLITEWRKSILENPYMGLFQWYDYLDAENKQGIINVKESADILRKLSLTTYESEFKIMIIWMPEKMHQASANKLLKILEEPPDKTLFILVSENEDQLLRTILSRTQLIKVNRISDEDLRKFLIENKTLSEEEAIKIVHLADGNYNLSLQLINESENAAYNAAAFQGWMRMCLRFDATKVLSWVNELSTTGRERQKKFLLYALHIIRESLMLNYGDERLVKLQGDELEFVKKFSPFINNANCERFMVEINKAHRQIERNANPKILFLDLSFKVNELLNVPVKSV